MKIGIFFGGQSREREVSFAGGRTVYDNLNKNLFEAVPIFVDSLGNFILLDWQYIYKGTIRDFYPPLSELQATNSPFQIYIESLGKLENEEIDKVFIKVGKKITPEQFKNYFDFALLALHGLYGEDGNIQGILEWQGIPYSGSGTLASVIGINKIAQSAFLRTAGLHKPRQSVISKKEWLSIRGSYEEKDFFSQIKNEIGLPLVVKSPNQGSSIGISIVKSTENLARAIDKSLFIQHIPAEDWKSLNPKQKEQFLVQFTDIREGLGFPVVAEVEGENPKFIYHPQELWNFLDEKLLKNQTVSSVRLSAEDSEEFVLFEQFLEGKEFSCIVIQDEKGEPLALPPTEIRKFDAVFDYRAKYLPGTSRKITPIETDIRDIEEIRRECCRLFKILNCNVYARIDGFLSKEGMVYLNDPNTTSGMMPSSFFFHQAAEIGLNASNFLTYIIRTSLAERIKTGKKNFQIRALLNELDAKIQADKNTDSQKIRVAVIMGGYSTERHISMESGRNIYEKLASSTKYIPFPVFLTSNSESFDLYILPVNYMLKDNADDVKERIMNYESGKENKEIEVEMKKIWNETREITQKYAGISPIKPQKIALSELAEKADVVFIALHGRPGEDGALQQELEILNLPYNGSGIASSQITINKYETNETLKYQGINVPKHALIYQSNWQKDRNKVIEKIENEFIYPLIAKPADDGCSSAVKKIKNRTELTAFAEMMFRPEPEFLTKESEILKLKINEEFPQKGYFLIEELIEKGDAKYFMEITGGLLTKWTMNNEQLTINEAEKLSIFNYPFLIDYEIFEPSETLALGDVLSLEEKFLAGEGQNITPAVYSKNEEINQKIAEKVKAELKKVAQILQIEGYARIDAFVKVHPDNRVEVIIIEVNSLPGMTPATCIFHQCAINGYKPYHFIDAILNFAMEKNKKASEQKLAFKS